MTTSEERIAKALESLVMIVDDIRAQMVMEKQDDRETQARGFLDLNTMKPLKTVSGRLVGYAFPNETITMRETSPSTVATAHQQVFNPPFILLRGLTTSDATLGQTKFFGQLVTPEGMTLEVHGTYQDVI